MLRGKRRVLATRAKALLAAPLRTVKTLRKASRIARHDGLSLVGMLRELRVLNRDHRIDGYVYFINRLHDPSLTWEQKSSYLPDSRAGNAWLWSLLNPERYWALYDNKLIFNRYFAAMGLPVAKLYGYYDPLFGRSVDGDALRNPAELSAWLERIGLEEFVFKPVEGISGVLTLIFAGRAAREEGEPLAFVTPAGERYDVARIHASTRDPKQLNRIVNENPGATTSTFLIEERLRMHGDLVALIGGSGTLCTFRILTVTGCDGRATVQAAVFKMQPEPTGVDHLSKGALGCWVDPQTGALCEGRAQGGARTTLVPGTNVSFKGFVIPQWQEVIDTVLRAADAFPWARSIGWDVALTDRGPVIVEGNERWGTGYMQQVAPHGLMRGELRALCDSLERARRCKGQVPR